MQTGRTTLTGRALDELPPTLSVEEAAQLCGIGRNAAYRAAQEGELPAFRLGRKWRVPTAALLRLLAVGESAEQELT